MMSATHQRIVVINRLVLLLFTVLLMSLLWSLLICKQWPSFYGGPQQRITIVVITPTYPRPERLADMTRLSQTLMHVPNLHWLVVEDGNSTAPPVERLLQRSGLSYSYLYATTAPGYPPRGWTHRNLALQFLRKTRADWEQGQAVIYFGDDDNSYDIRLFDQYIRHVKGIGIWAVGMAGGAAVEAPQVENGKIVGWHAIFAPERQFAVDMAGFAINMELILSTNASFNRGCVNYAQGPESCFLAQFGVPRARLEPFGWDAQPKEILVWHTKTAKLGTAGSTHGYVFEYPR